MAQQKIQLEVGPSGTLSENSQENVNDQRHDTDMDEESSQNGISIDHKDKNGGG